MNDHRRASNGNHRMPTAQEIMVTSLITFKPETSIFDAIQMLISKRISGAPVVDADGEMVGMLSELDCLRVLSSDEFYNGQQEEAGLVRDFMTDVGQSIPPDMEVYAIAHYFLTTPVRRLPVLAGRRKLVGQVSRRDVLAVIDELSRKKLRKHYPDYREPA